MKRLLLISLVALLFPLVASAYDVEIDGIYYDVGKMIKQATVTSGDNKYTGSVVIPATIDFDGATYNVIAIGEKAFDNCSGLTSVTIPSSVTSIKYSAFQGCSGLTAVTIPNSVTSIGNGAFSGCSGLTSVTIPNSVTSIDSAIFESCSGLTSVTIPNSVTTIGSFTFYRCSGLTSLIIPSSVTSIGPGAFADCSGLTSLTIPSSVTFIGSIAFEGCNGLKSLTVSWDTPISLIDSNAISGITSSATFYVPAGTKAKYQAAEGWNLFTNIVELGGGNLNVGDTFTGLTAEGVTMTFKVTSIDPMECQVGSETGPAVSEEVTGNVTIPSTVNGFSVTSIGRGAFSGLVGVTAVTIPNSVKTIGDNAFAYSGLTAIEIPNSVTSIGELAFDYCLSLSSVTIGNSVKTIGKWAFDGCRGLATVTIPASVTSIGEKAFQACEGLMEVVSLSETPFAISDDVFNTSLRTPIYTSGTLRVPYGTKALYQATDGWKNFQNIVEGTLKVGDIFTEKTKEGVTMTFKVMSLEPMECQVGDGTETAISTTSGNVTIPSESNGFSITEIASNSFWGSGVSCVTLPKSLTFIDSKAFGNNPNLKEIIATETAPFNFEDDAFSNDIYAVSIMRVNPITLQAYQSSKAGIMFSNIQASSNGYYMPGSIINEKVWKDHIMVFKVTADNICQVGNGANASVYSGTAESIKIPDTAKGNIVNAIGRRAFYNCRELKRVYLSENIEEIGDEAFSDCINLTTIDLPRKVEKISKTAFNNCGSREGKSVVVNYHLGQEKVLPSSDNYTPKPIEPTEEDYEDLKRIYIPSTLTWYLGKGIFKKCYSIVEMVVDEGNPIFDSRNECNAIIRTADNTLLYGCQNTHIPSTVTAIDESAFEGHNNLCWISIPAKVAAIGELAFYGCTGLEKVYSHIRKLYAINDNTFSTDTYEYATLYVPFGFKQKYESTGGWKNFKHIVEMNPPRDIINFADPLVKKICVENWDTDDDGELTETEAKEVKTLAKKFKENDITSFEELKYFTSLVNILESEFYGCNNLSSIILPSSLISIGDRAIDASSLSQIVIPRGVSSLTGLGTHAFARNNNLMSITVEEGNMTYDSRDNCNAIIHTATNHLVIGTKNTIIPATVTEISPAAFKGVQHLETITLPANLKMIGAVAFNGCTEIKKITSNITELFAIFDDTFEESVYQNTTLIVAKGMRQQYQQTSGWKNFQNIIEEDYDVGDLNNDGNVNGIDLAKQTIIILTGQYNPVADLNNDMKVNGTDYVLMVNKILDISTARSIRPAKVNRVPSSASLSIEKFNIKAGETKEMIIDLTNLSTDVTLVQFDLRLPSGLSIVEENGEQAIDIAGRTTWKKHSLQANTINGIVRFLLSSDTNALLSETSGAIISIKLTAGSCFNGGNIKLEEQLIVTPNAEETTPVDYILKIEDETLPETAEAGEIVDLGLASGVRWADRNLGATDMTSTGTYFAWGDNVARASYSESDYVFNGGNLPQDIIGTEYDAAHQLWGGEWRMPTYEEVEELISRCTWTYTTRNGVNGYLIQGLTGHYIFLPMPGYKEGTATNTSSTYYWAGNQSANSLSKALSLTGNGRDVRDIRQFLGALIRPVYGEISHYIPTDNITFADANVKAICVENWDTDHDGELSKQEAAAVTSIGTVFSEEWEITSFDELQYFTGLTAIDDNAFAGCDGLTSITLPNTVTSLGTYAFSGCDGLTSFVIPSSVTTLNDAVFNYCVGLTSIIIPKSVTRMGFNPLNGCSALTSIQVESGNPNFDSRNGCNAIIYGKSGILVSGCKNTVIPDGIKTIWQYAFGGCEELTSITIPASVTTFGDYAFFGCYNLEEIHSEIVQPSAINATVFGNTDIFTTATLYVPAGTKAQYQATDGWKDFRNIVEQGGTATDIASATITIENTSYPYTGSAIEPAVSVVYSGTTLVKGTDYSLSYKNNIMAGTATVTATGSGNYTGTVTATFTIDKAQLVVTAQSIMREYGEENPGFTCKISGFMNEDTVLDLTKLPAITTTATSMSSVGTYDITVSGGEARNYSFNYVAGTLTIVPKDIATATVTVADSCAYTGFSVCPDVTVVLNGQVLMEGIDYTMTLTHNVMPGVASLTITGLGNYTGSITKTFVIFNPQPTVDDLLPDEGDNNGASDYSSGESGVNESTDLNEKVVGNVYYCITPDAGGYDAEEGCLVINKAATTVSTELPAVDGQLPSASNGFRGLVFFVNAGRGKVKIKAETTGNLLLCVKIAGELVMSMAVEGKTTLTIPYDVSQPSEVLVYAGFAAGSRGTVPSTTEDALKIYSLEWESEPTAIGVEKIENGKLKIENYYDLKGRKVNGQLKKGVYIVGGRKVVIK